MISCSENSLIVRSFGARIDADHSRIRIVSLAFSRIIGRAKRAQSDRLKLAYALIENLAGLVAANPYQSVACVSQGGNASLNSGRKFLFGSQFAIALGKVQFRMARAGGSISFKGWRIRTGRQKRIG